MVLFRRLLRSIVVALAAFGFLREPSSARLRAQPPEAKASERKDGLVVSVPTPITSETAEQVRRRVADAVHKQKRTLGAVVFDFNPDETPTGTASFGACLELAEVIRRIHLGEPGIPPTTTVAFVHKAVTKHSVLPALACSQIVFGRDGSLGDVPREDIAKPTVRAAYREQAKHHASPDVALRVFDPDLLLQRVKTPEGERIASSVTLAEWKKLGKEYVLSAAELRGLEPGRALIDADTARECGLAQALHDGRGELVEALGLSRRALHDDGIAEVTPSPWRVELRGPIDAGRIQSLERRLKTAVARGANVIVLHLESEGGEARHVASLAERLRSLKGEDDGRRVRTIAYVPSGRRLGAATLLAVGCNEIVLGKDAALGEFRDQPKESLVETRDVLVRLVRLQGYPPLLFQASADPETRVVRVKPASAPGSPFQLVTESEFEADRKSPAPRWSGFGALPRGSDGLLPISTELAREWQVAAASDVDTLDAVYAYAGFEGDRVRVSRDDALDRVAEFFREPWVNFLLVMFGIIGLILEMKMPGTTVPGTLAAICFLLFFWAHSFVGEFAILAGFLFIAGLAMILIEVFVIPGFGFVGLAGIVLTVGSLALVTLDRWPTTSQDWMDLGSTLLTFGLSIVAATIGAIAIARYLPNIPYANRMVLRPPDEYASGDVTAAAPTRFAHLLGAVGVALTTLRPSGKAQFGEEFLDVIAEGDYVEAGKRLQVVEIEGYRIVVKEL